MAADSGRKNRGPVPDLRPAMYRIMDRVVEHDGPMDDACWIYTGPHDQDGYGKLSVVCGDGVRRNVGAHRLMWQETHGCVDGKLCVCHKCDQPYCCNPSHLFLGTNADNTKDSARKGRRNGWKISASRKAAGMARGERNPKAKLSLLNAHRVRMLYVNGGVPSKKIGEWYGVHPATVMSIVRGRTWRTTNGC